MGTVYLAPDLNLGLNTPDHLDTRDEGDGQKGTRAREEVRGILGMRHEGETGRGHRHFLVLSVVFHIRFNLSFRRKINFWWQSCVLHWKAESSWVLGKLLLETEANLGRMNHSHSYLDICVNIPPIPPLPNKLSPTGDGFIRSFCRWLKVWWDRNMTPTGLNFRLCQQTHATLFLTIIWFKKYCMRYFICV